MRVLLFSATPRSDRGGVQQVMAALDGALAARGVPRMRLGPDERPGATTAPFAAEASASADGRPKVGALPDALGSAWRLAAVLNRFRPTVVNFHFLTGALAYFIALRPFFGYRLVLSTHGSDVLLPPPSLIPHLPRFLRMVDAITVVSEPVAEAVRHKAPGVSSKLSVIPNGVDTEFWTPGLDKRQPLIAAAGRLNPVKGFDLLLAALAGLPQANAVVLGDGPQRPELEDQARRLGVADRLSMPGHLEPQAMRDCFRQASVFALPSRSEGLPLALLEAMACGLPVVASQVGGIPSVVTPESGVIVPPEDAVALREGLAAVLAGRTAASGEGARRQAAGFSRRSMVNAYISLLHEQSGRKPVCRLNRKGAAA